jgi:hypothetical protein
MTHQVPTLTGLLQSSTESLSDSIPERDGSGDIYGNVLRGSAGLRSAGHLYLDTKAKTSSFTIDESSNNGTTYLVDASGGAVTVTLPAATSSTDKVVIVKKTSATSLTLLVTIDGNASETIDGLTTYIMYGLDEFVAIHCDGTEWHVIDAGGKMPVLATTTTATAGTHRIPTFYTCDATGGAYSITLPAAANMTGIPISFKKIDASGNAITLDGNASETIDNATTNATVLAAQYDSCTIVSDGSEFWIIDFSN